jgi:hypothetical protein
LREHSLVLPMLGSGQLFKQIEEKDDASNVSVYRGGAPGRDRDLEKERLALVMQFKGKTPEEVAEGMRAEQFCPAGKKKGHKQPPHEEEGETTEQIVDRLLLEVQERQKFLQEMRELGRGAEYDMKILGEIRMRMRQIDQIEREHFGSSKGSVSGIRKLPGNLPPR